MKERRSHRLPNRPERLFAYGQKLTGVDVRPCLAFGRTLVKCSAMRFCDRYLLDFINIFV